MLIYCVWLFLFVPVAHQRHFDYCLNCTDDAFSVLGGIDDSKYAISDRCYYFWSDSYVYSSGPKATYRIEPIKCPDDTFYCCVREYCLLYASDAHLCVQTKFLKPSLKDSGDFTKPQLKERNSDGHGCTFHGVCEGIFKLIDERWTHVGDDESYTTVGEYSRYDLKTQCGWGQQRLRHMESRGGRA